MTVLIILGVWLALSLTVLATLLWLGRPKRNMGREFADGYEQAMVDLFGADRLWEQRERAVNQ